jgi:poly(A) polymerase
MCGAGLLIPVLAGIAMPLRLKRVMKIEGARGLTPDPFLRLMALCVLVREDALRLRDELRLSNAECDRARDAARVLETLHGMEEPPSPSDLRTLLFRHGRQASLDALLLAQAESHAPAESQAFAKAAAFLSDTPQPQLPFSGADLLARGLTPGPAVGETLKQLQALWIRAGFPDEPAILHRLLSEALRDSLSQR